MRRSVVLFLLAVMCWSVQVAMAATTTKSRIAYVDLGTVRGGPVVLHGNVVDDSVFHFQARVTITGRDTVWNNLLVNGLAVDRPDSAATIEVPALNTQRFELRQAVNDANKQFVADRRAAGRPATAREITEFKAERYRQATTLVNSAEVVSDREFIVCWMGDEDCEHFVLGGMSGSPAKPGESLRSQARQYERRLQEGRVLFIRRGAVFAPSPTQSREYRTAIKAIKGGQRFELSLFPDAKFVREIDRPPVSVEALKRSVEER